MRDKCDDLAPHGDVKSVKQVLDEMDKDARCPSVAGDTLTHTRP
jgi:hypothetical protein